MTDESYRSRGGERVHAAPARIHFLRWAPADWLGSVLRAELAIERDHVTRLVYRELLDVLHQRGGYLQREEVAGACMVSAKQAERAVERLLRSGRGRLVQTDDGRLFNERVLRDLAREAAFRGEQAEHGRSGARRRWAGHGVAQGEPIGSDGLPTPTPTPIPTPAPISEPRSVPEGGGCRDSSGGECRGEGERDAGEEALPLKARIETARQRFSDWGLALRRTNALRTLIAALPWRAVEQALDETNAARVDRHAEDPAAYFVGILKRKRAALKRAGADRG